jgi:nucleotide-binding universal stress UspA family protein
MRLFAQAPRGRRYEQVLVAVPHGAAAWTDAIRSRGLHRLLVPVASSVESLNALRYVSERLADRVASVHLVNVQRPLATTATCPRIPDRAATASRQALGEHLLAGVRRSLEPSVLRMTAEVAFGSPAETICALAQPQRFSGIVIGRSDFALDDLIGRSVIAKILQLARVPVTIVSARTAAARAVAGKTHAADLGGAIEKLPSLAAPCPRAQDESLV